MSEEKPKFEIVNRLGEVFEGTTRDDARQRLIASARADLAARYAAEPESVEGFALRMSRLAAARKREQQRIDHLVLGKPRPIERVTEGRRKGRRKPRVVERPARLEPGIEEAMQVREAWSHKGNGTPETWERARTHDGALKQLEINGTITSDQLEWATQIANVYRSLEADVGVKVASLEARVDQSRRASGLAAERVYRVRMHLAYGYWRQALPVPKQMVLDMIVGDAIGYTVAARLYRVHNRKAKRFLIEAINRWPRCVVHAFSLVDQHMVDAVNEGRAVDPVWLAQWERMPPRPVGAGQQDRPAKVGAIPLPLIDPAFLDEKGHLLEWSDIAAVIRTRFVDCEEDAA